jgi:ribosomal protein S18 acetylase RimI-like enzyme
MSSITIPAREERHAHLRTMNMFRDLPAVADLVELCFADTMDGEGRRYVQDMRRSGSDNAFLKWASRAAETTSLPLTGYIWEENGRIVGNASLVPFRHRGQRIYLIANVAVHPDHRRKGIARALTERALQHARDKRIHEIWLHVREDNPEAAHLYSEIGFVERARRTTWKAGTDLHAPRLESDIAVTGRHPLFWETQRHWLSRLYPDFLAWHRNWNFNSLRPGLWTWFYLLFVDMNIRQWAAVRGDELLATLAWIPSEGGDSLFAGAGEGCDPEALTGLLLRARRDLYHLHPKISMDFPAGIFDDAIRAAGFDPARTLIWMQATL